MADKNALARSSHAMLFIVFFQPLQPRDDRRVLLRLRLLCSESIVGERVESNRSRLVS